MTVRVWDAATGQCQATLEGHSDSVYLVAFSSDSKRLASASGDKTVKVWDAARGHCQATLDTGARLLTDAGTFDLSVLLPSLHAILSTRSPLYHPCQRQGYGISDDGIWITYQGQNLLWLPSECRPETLAIAASTVALGCRSGRVFLIQFSGEAPS
ncbi:WD40-repeat-containing domain protein [Dactylonectria macrodidyma]|uniref:WD40-repeat-containing domain protein n=1 Tax=Dactylonectria macrodidyma TaxID=307937 RepID=A0A9P9DEH8_9HYPO|nr:WD40-repeat-containing domain protein [Dactylonectria macrodidyma]